VYQLGRKLGYGCMLLDKVIISIMVLCNDSVIVEYDRRRPGLSSAPVVMEHNNNRDHRVI